MQTQMNGTTWLGQWTKTELQMKPSLPLTELQFQPPTPLGPP